MSEKSVSKMIKVLGTLFVGVIVVMFLFLRKGHLLDGDGMVNTLSGSLTGVEYCLTDGTGNKHTQISLLPSENGKLKYSYIHISGDGDEERISFETDEYRLDSFMEICHSTECLIYNTPSAPANEKTDKAETVVFILGEQRIVFDTANTYPENCSGIYEYVYNAFMAVKDQYI